MGGDEFTLLLVNIHGQSDVELVAAKLNESIEKPMRIRGHTINITASIGLAIYPLDGINREQLSSAADTDMYRQKNDSQLKQLRR